MGAHFYPIRAPAGTDNKMHRRCRLFQPVRVFPAALSEQKNKTAAVSTMTFTSLDGAYPARREADNPLIAVYLGSYHSREIGAFPALAVLGCHCCSFSLSPVPQGLVN